MPQYFYQKLWFKIILRVLVGIVLFVLIVGISVNAYWSPIIGEKVKKAVYTATDSLYQVDFSKIKLHVLKGSIVIDDITLTPDTSLYNKRKLSGDAANNLYQLQVKRLILDHVHPWKLYRYRELQLGAIRVVNPIVEVRYENLLPTDSLQKDKMSLYEHIKNDLNSIKVDLIDLQDVTLKYVDWTDKKKPRETVLKDLDLTATQLLIDSATQFDKSRFLYCTNVVAKLENYKASILNGMYTYHFKSLQVSTQKNTLEVAGLTLKPNLTDQELMAKYKVQKERYDLSFDSIKMKGFDLQVLNKYRNLRASRIYLKGGAANVFLDRRLPKPDIDKGGNYPNNMLKRLRLDLKADTVSLQDIDVSYTEFNPQTEMKGKVVLKKLEGDIFNVTNNKTALKSNPNVDAYLSTFLMNYGKMDVHLQFNLTDQDASFSCDGSLGKMELRHLNPVAQPLGTIRINSGMVNSLKFDMKGNVHGARGKVTFLYDNFKVSLLKRDTADQVFKKQSLMSMIANVLILKDANPDAPKGTPRVSSVTLQRPRQASFFNLIWKVVFSGVKDAIGLTQNVELQMKEKAATIKQHKKEREQRREERESLLKKREE